MDEVNSQNSIIKSKKNNLSKKINQVNNNQSDSYNKNKNKKSSINFINEDVMVN